VEIDDRPEDEIVAELLEVAGGDEETARQIVRQGKLPRRCALIELPDEAE
jgi:hypothetical protein